MPRTVTKKQKRLLREQTRIANRAKNEENARRREELNERVQRALELIRGGATYREVVDAGIGFSNPGSVSRAIQKYRAREVRMVSADVLATDLERLDEFTKRCTYALRQNGDLSQIDRLLRIMDTRYRLLGIGDDTIKELREKSGVSTQIQNNGVMIVQTTESSENDFIKKMMQAVGVDPEAPETQRYMESRTVKEIEAPKSTKPVVTKRGKKIVVRKGKKTPPPAAPPLATSYGEIPEQDIVDAEIIEDGPLRIP